MEIGPALTELHSTADNRRKCQVLGCFRKKTRKSDVKVAEGLLKIGHSLNETTSLLSPK
jgi:hypothetical protein